MKLLSLSLLLASLVAADRYGNNSVAVRPDTDLVAANFADVDIPLLSPAFLDPDSREPAFANGTQGPTSMDQMIQFMQSVASRNDYMTYSEKSFTSEELRPFPYVRLSESSHYRRRRDTSGKIRIWIQGAAHGNEPAGDQALLALLGKFDAEPEWAAGVLAKTDIVIMPRYNPDGVAYFQRTLASNFDPNRDHIKLARQQTRDIKSQFSGFDPHVVIDMHEYGATTPYGPYVQAADGLFSAAKNLNINEDIRQLSEELFARNMGEAMGEAGLRWEPYVTGPSSRSEDFVPNWAEAGTDGKIGRNAMGLTQAVTFLIEMRGIGIADQEFQRRTASGLVMATAIVETARDEHERVFSTITNGRQAFIESDEDIVITDYSETSTRPYQMVEVATGDVVRVNSTFASTTPAIANTTRARPEAYLIPVAWADVAERLRVGGLQVETLSDGFKGSVEAYNVTSVSFDRGYYEGVVRATAKIEALTKDVSLPAGSFRVSTRQKNAALAFIGLEPENIDSYVSFNILPVEVGDEYPIYREMA